MMVRHSALSTRLFIAWKAFSCAGFQSGNLSSAALAVREVSMVVRLASLRRKVVMYLTRPRKALTSLHDLGLGHEVILSVLALSGSIPHTDIRWPRKMISVQNRSDFFMLQ